MTGYQSLRPSDICYSQDSIDNTFRNGKKIGEVLDDLCENRLRIEDIPTITVIDVGGTWISHDNRRLWVYKHMERLGKCSEIEVYTQNRISTAKLTSKSSGKTIKVRGDPGGKWYKHNAGGSWFGKLTTVAAVAVGILFVLARP